MQFLIIPKKYHDKLLCDGRLSEQEKEEIRDYLEFDKDIELKETNIGPGADLTTLLVIAAGLFFLGDKINKNLDGWIEIGNKLKRLFEKDELVAIDSHGADCLCISYLAQKEQINEVEKFDEHCITYMSLAGMLPDRQDGEFISEPHNYYVKTFIVNTTEMYVLGVSSKGEVTKIKHFEYGCPYGMLERKQDTE